MSLFITLINTIHTLVTRGTLTICTSIILNENTSTEIGRLILTGKLEMQPGPPFSCILLQ